MDSLVRGKDSFCRDDNDPMTFAVDGKDTYVSSMKYLPHRSILFISDLTLERLTLV